MRGRIVHFLLVVCLSMVGVSTLEARGIVLIGWDGASRARVGESLDRKELPNLQRLIDRGKYVTIDIEGSADAKAGWTQILTGYLPEITGVYSNDRYQPVPKGLSLIERLKPGFETDEFRDIGGDGLAGVAVIADREHVGAVDPPRKTRLDGPRGGDDGNAPIEEENVTYRIVPGAPFYNMRSALDVWESGLERNEKVGKRALELLNEYRRRDFFFLVEFDELDRARRAHGEQSPKYQAALISTDLWTGRILDEIERLGLSHRTKIYLTSSHGSDAGQTESDLPPSVFLVTNDQAVTRHGRRQDITPTILEAMGPSPSLFKPPYDGISLAQVDPRPPIKAFPADEQRIPVTAPAETPRRPDVVYVPTPHKVVDTMLKLAQVKQSDVVYDLGCGDGRIVVTAAKQLGCRAFGYDIDPERVAESLTNVAENGVGDLVTIEQKDIFTLDLSGADVVTLYLLPSLNVRLIPQLEKLKPGSRIVSHDFDMKGVQPDKVIRIDTDDSYVRHTVYLWTCPLKKVDPNSPDVDNGD